MNRLPKNMSRHCERGFWPATVMASATPRLRAKPSGDRLACRIASAAGQGTGLAMTSAAGQGTGLAMT